MKERDSNIELLRIAALVGIAVMHGYGPFLQEPTVVNLLFGQLCCSVFNTGVTLFMLISGYYGMRFSMRKAAVLWLTVVFYALLSGALTRLTGGTVDWLKCLHPVTAGTYWFMTAYLLIFFCSPLLNRAAEKAGAKLGGMVLLLLVVGLYVVPFLLGGHLMHDGKNPLNMAVVYLLGRGIRLYAPAALPQRFTAAAALLSLGAVFGGDYLLSLHFGRTMLPLSADNSPFILSSAAALFLWVREKRFVSPRINACAAHVLAIYLFEGAWRGCCARWLPLNDWATLWCFPLIIAVLSGGICLLCMGTDVLRGSVCRLLLTAVQRLCARFSA